MLFRSEMVDASVSTTGDPAATVTCVSTSATSKRIAIRNVWSDCRGISPWTNFLNAGDWTITR